MYIEVHLMQGLLISYFYLRSKEWKIDRTVILILLFSIISDFDFIPFILGIIPTRKLFTYALYTPLIIYIFLKITYKYHKANYKYIVFSYVTHMHSDMIGYTPTLYLFPLLLHFPTAPPEIYFNHFFIQFCDTYALLILLMWLSTSEHTHYKLLLCSFVIYFVSILIVIYSLAMHNIFMFLFASVVSLMHFPLAVFFIFTTLFVKKHSSI
ncbi:MAG: hypothetical protein ACP6IS_10015 [Candidatus Asgardarchaeia archaeon]